VIDLKKFFKNLIPKVFSIKKKWTRKVCPKKIYPE
jgi:hypothetical protein